MKHIDWIRLSLIPTIGPRRFFALLSAFGSPTAALNASASALDSVLGKASACHVKAGLEDGLLQKALDWGKIPGNRIIVYDDADYPDSLKAIEAPPPVLYAIGDVSLLKSTAIAMVGSRHPTEEGKDNAEAFARSLSHAGITVVSGLASGVDTHAHMGALSGIGSSIAVMGTGADLIYPASNRQLAADMADKGLLITEFPLGTAPDAKNFPRRNRIISGLSFGCLIVEAALLSGSLITARYALEQGKEVFAIPGSIHNPQVKGCHQLIKQGAKLVESIADVLEEIKLLLPKAAESSLSGFSEGLTNLTVVDPDPVTKVPRLSSSLNVPLPEKKGLNFAELEKAQSDERGDLKNTRLDKAWIDRLTGKEGSEGEDASGCNIKDSAEFDFSKKVEKPDKKRSRFDESCQKESDSLSSSRQASRPALHGEILTVMGDETLDPDTLAARLNMDMGALQVKLLELEMYGFVERLQTGKYRRTGR